MGNPLEALGPEANELVASFRSTPVWGSLDGLGITQYTFWFFVAVAIMMAILVLFRVRQARSLAPKGIFVNVMECLVEFVRDDMCKGLLGDSWRRHFPFIATIFMVVLANNLMGVIPGAKPGTGSISVTAALAVFSFVYFIVCGVRTHGALGYARSLAPSGVMFPLNVLVWLIELFSTFLRLITLAVRLFCNMLAGHIVMGTFAILAALFFEPLLQAVTPLAAASAGASVLWALVLIAIYVVELMVAVIQAYVFSLLSAIYIQLAEAKGH